MPTINIRDDLADEIMAKWKKENPFKDNWKLTHVMQQLGIDYLNHKKKNEE